MSQHRAQRRLRADLRSRLKFLGAATKVEALGIAVAEAYFDRCYQLNAVGDRIQVPLPWTDLHYCADVRVGEIVRLFYALSGGEQDEVLYLQGRDRAGNPYFTVDAQGGCAKFYLSDAAYGWDDPVPAYADRQTSTGLAGFLAGARVLTPAGEVAVETLSPGDIVLTADGRAVPVTWIGLKRMSGRCDREVGEAPIHIAAGALGPDLPVRALQLTADQALMIDGVLVQAAALVNGVSIRSMTPTETGERYVICHVETDDHDVILTEGCLAETFIAATVRRRFDNHADYDTLFAGLDDDAGAWDLPRINSRRLLPASVRDRIAVRCAA